MSNVKLPRLESKSELIVFPSQLNNVMGQLEIEINKIDDKIEDSNKKIDGLNKRLDEFYGRLIEIFAIFVAIFSLIIISVQNLVLSKGKDIWETALNSLGFMLPLTAVLFIFILLLNYLRKS